MRWLATLGVWVLPWAAWAATAAAVPPIDGVLSDWSGTRAQFQARSGMAQVLARVGLHDRGLLLGVEVKDGLLSDQASVRVSLRFLKVGEGPWEHTFSTVGKRLSPVRASPRFTWERLVQAARRTEDRLVLEVFWPREAFPRFPARGPLLAEVCVTYLDGDGRTLRTCRGGSGQRLQRPSSVREGLPFELPAAAVALEPRAGGWVGYSRSGRSPAWVWADAALTGKLLREMVYGGAQPPPRALTPVPTLHLPDGRALHAAVFGEDPNGEDGCAPKRALWAVWYVFDKGRADRVLEQPLVTCKLGRAQSMSIDRQGVLHVGYSEGLVNQYVWNRGRFEPLRAGLP